MALPDIIIQHCERESLTRLIERLESGRMQTGENHGRGWVDTTQADLARNKERLTVIERILADAKKVKAASGT